MPKRTRKKTSIKQKQKVKVIVNVNNKIAKAKQGRRRSSAPRQPQQIIIQQPSMISRELPMPMFNPIQQASAPPVFQGVGQMLQPPNELLRNIYREEPDFENYSQMPYMQTNLQAPQFEEPAEIQREVASVSSSVSKSNLSGTATTDYSSQSNPRSVDADTQESKRFNLIFPTFKNQFIDVNAINRGFDEPMPQDIPLPEMIKPKRGVQFSDDEVSLQPTMNLQKTPKIIQNMQGEETDTSIATTTTKMPKKRRPKKPKEKLKITEGKQPDEPNETQIVAPEFFTFGQPKRRGRGRPSSKLIPTEGKIENSVYNLIMNSTTADFENSGVQVLNELLRGIGTPYYQKMKKPEKIQYLLQYQKKETKGNKLFDDLIEQID
jgi:hypothetical protein